MKPPVFLSCSVLPDPKPFDIWRSSIALEAVYKNNDGLANSPRKEYLVHLLLKPVNIVYACQNNFAAVVNKILRHFPFPTAAISMGNLTAERTCRTDTRKLLFLPLLLLLLSLLPF